MKERAPHSRWRNRTAALARGLIAPPGCRSQAPLSSSGAGGASYQYSGGGKSQHSPGRSKPASPSRLPGHHQNHHPLSDGGAAAAASPGDDGYGGDLSAFLSAHSLTELLPLLAGPRVRARAAEDLELLEEEDLLRLGAPLVPARRLLRAVEAEMQAGRGDGKEGGWGMRWEEGKGGGGAACGEEEE